MTGIPYNTAYDLLLHQADKYEDKKFAIFPKDDDYISYGELFEQSMNYSKFFFDNGIRRSSRVSIVGSTSREFLFSLSAVLNLGAIAHPVDPNMVEEDAARNISNFESEFIIYSPESEEYVSTITEEVKAEDKTKLIPVDLEELAEDACEDKNSLDSSIFSLTSKEDPALCIFTSGTTGDPKGVLLSHKNVLFGADCLKSSHGIGEKDRVLSVTPLSGVNGNVFSIWAPLITGGSAIYYHDMFTPYTAFEIMDQYNATWFNGIPTHYSLMVNHPVDKDSFDLSDMKFMRSASAHLPVSVQERFEDMYEIPIIETYGLSEMSGQVCSNPMEVNSRKKGSVGEPVNAAVRIVGGKGNNAIIGKGGEILCRGEGLMIGYLDDDATKEAVKDGWLYTGDIGYVDNNGFVYIKGRKKDIAIVGGKNVSMREVEEVLYSNKKVIEAVAFGVPDDMAGEKIVAFVKLGEEHATTEREIKNYCSQHLSEYKCPEVIKFCRSFPRGGQGNILRSKVKAMFMKGEIKNGE